MRRDLTRLRAFSRCGRRELRYVAKWGELVEVQAGQVIVRQGRGDYWFFVVVAGAVRLTRDGLPLATLGPGSHFGEWTVVGLRPQPATATAAERSVLLVLGPQYALSLLALAGGFQRTMFPDVGSDDYPDFARRMNRLGRAEWQGMVPALPQPGIPTPRGPTGSALGPSGSRSLEARMVELRSARRPPGRQLTMTEAALLLAERRPGEDPRSDRITRRHRTRRRAAVWSLGACVAANLTLILYHPPRIVLTPGQAVDVVGDIRIGGAPVHHPSGRFLLLWVRQSRPDLAGLLWALVRHRTTVGIDPARDQGSDQAALTSTARRQYLDSQQTAIRVALAASGLDPRRVSVHIRDRGLGGPSAGLVYALAVDDLLTGADLTHGQVLAVTGALAADGRVVPVGLVSMKAQAAAAAGAGELLVPLGEGRAGRGWVARVQEVASLEQAVGLLTRQP